MTTAIYTDWQSQTQYEGEGRLIRHVSKGLPFLFDDSQPEREQQYFYCDKWLVELNGFKTTRCILRKLPARKRIIKETLHSDAKIEDSFISFHGIEVF